jgi:PAS domain S-box-containing protein
LDRAREAAEAERRRFADLFGLYPAAYLKTTPTGVIQEANQAAATLLGDASPAALVGQSLALFVAEEDRDAFLSQLESLPERGRVADWRVRVTGHGDEAHGVPIPVTLTVAALRDEGGGR